MACKFRYRFLITAISMILIITSLYYYKYNICKKILFYNYIFDNEKMVAMNFSELGFKYKKNFSECPEKKILLDSTKMQFIDNNGYKCIIFSYNSNSIAKMNKKILNKYSVMVIEESLIPDNFLYHEYQITNKWELKDREIFILKYPSVEKVYITKKK